MRRRRRGTAAAPSRPGREAPAGSGESPSPAQPPPCPPVTPGRAAPHGPRGLRSPRCAPRRPRPGGARPRSPLPGPQRAAVGGRRARAAAHRSKETKRRETTKWRKNGRAPAGCERPVEDSRPRSTESPSHRCQTHPYSWGKARWGRRMAAFPAVPLHLTDFGAVRASPRSKEIEICVVLMGKISKLKMPVLLSLRVACPPSAGSLQKSRVQWLCVEPAWCRVGISPNQNPYTKIKPGLSY